jgi:hypothetical protein
MRPKPGTNLAICVTGMASTSVSVDTINELRRESRSTSSRRNYRAPAESPALSFGYQSGTNSTDERLEKAENNLDRAKRSVYHKCHVREWLRIVPVIQPVTLDQRMIPVLRRSTLVLCCSIRTRSIKWVILLLVYLVFLHPFVQLALVPNVGSRTFEYS